MVENEIVRKYYMKSGAAVALALVLCAVASFALKTPGAWALGGLAFLYFGVNCLSLYFDIKGGHIVSVYATCMESTDTRARLNTNYKKSSVFRFSTVAENEEDETSLYILSANLSEFRIGAVYCLLFKKVPSGEFSERNLVTHQMIPGNAVSFNVLDGAKETGEAATLAEDGGQDMPDSDMPGKIVRLPIDRNGGSDGS